MMRVLAVCLPAIIAGNEQRAAKHVEPALHIVQQPNGAESSEICPKCGGEVLTNKPSGRGFCIQCDYTKSGKPHH